MEHDETIETGEVVEDATAEVADDAQVEEVATEEPTLDAWEALKAKGYEPDKLEKSFTRFTQELESVKTKERELEPYMQLKEALDSDPAVLAAFQQALEGAREGETEVDVLKREVEQMKQSQRVNAELASLKTYVADNELPIAVDEQAIMAHAAKNHIGNLKSAYNDLYFNEIRQHERESALNEVKGVQKAKAVTHTTSPTKAAQSFTEEEIAAMSPEEFQKNRAAIFASFK